VKSFPHKREEIGGKKEAAVFIQGRNSNLLEDRNQLRLKA
jgi:hypothetical protein